MSRGLAGVRCVRMACTGLRRRRLLAHCDGIDVFDYYLQERTVRARSRRMRTSTTERRPNPPLITPSRPRLAL